MADMGALYLTSDDNDLEFVLGALRFTASPGEVIAQKARVRLAFFLGEWFLDTSAGFPYFERVLVKGVDLSLVESLVWRTLLGIPEVDSILSVSLDLARTTRALTITWEVKAGTEVVSSDQYGPFVLKVQ